MLKRFDRDGYESWVQVQEDLPVWHQPWFLDATAGANGWDQVIAEDPSGIVGVLPFIRLGRMGFSHLTQPPLSQNLGPWIVPAKRNLPDSIQILEELVRKLPRAHTYSQSWIPEMNNWLPFYWSDFRQTTFYTYQLDLEKSEEALWEGLSSTCRNKIRKSSRSPKSLQFQPANFELFWPLVVEVYQRQGLRVPFSRRTLENVLNCGEERDAASATMLVDELGTALAAVLLIWDRRCTYYLVGASSHAGRQLGAMNRLLWHSILEAQRNGRAVFDFEGSMNREIGTFFRSFGADPVPYFHVWRRRNRLLRGVAEMRGMK